VVGPRAALAVTQVSASGRVHLPVTRVEAKLRARTPRVPASVEPVRGGFRLRLEQPVYGVARGQTAVLYADGAVVGAGRIRSAA
jgi:tRNA U34 2-thiouridine synthase MnmA/TrmU